MRKTTLIAVLVCLALISAAGAAGFYAFVYVDSVTIVMMDAEVSDRIGFNADTDAMHFGKMHPGDQGLRRFTVHNPRDYPVVVEPLFEGQMGPWIELNASDRRFVLEPQAKRTMQLRCTVPPATAFGKYNGTIRIISKRKLW